MEGKCQDTITKKSNKDTMKKIKEYYTSTFKSIYIDFSEFGKENNDFSEFIISLPAKKAYAKIAKFICSENNKFLNFDEKFASRFLFGYLTLKKAIDLNKFNNNENLFIAQLINTLVNNDLITIVMKYVDSEYIISIDNYIDLDTHKFDVGTTFMDRHFKAIYAISTVIKLIIPISVHFVYTNHSVETKTFFYNLFITIFNTIQTAIGYDIYSKLHTYIYRIVMKTQNTDKIMWDKLKILSKTPETVVEEAVKRIIVDVFPKFEFEKNIVNFITVATRKFVNWTIRKEHPVSIYTLSDVEGSTSNDDAVITEADLFDSYNVKRDETIIFLRKEFVMDTIQKIMIREKVEILPEELQFYKETVKFHYIQTSAIFQAFAHYFGGSENIYGCNKEQYVMLMIILVKMMRRLGINELAQYILAHRQNYNYRRISKTFDNMLFNNPMYKELIENKYKFITNLIENKNFIRNMFVVSINNNYSYNEYNNPKNGQIIEKNEELLCKDVLSFFNMIII